MNWNIDHWIYWILWTMSWVSPLFYLRSCQTQSGRTRLDSRWWCSWPPGWFSPQPRPRPGRTSPASPLLRLPPTLPRIAASCPSLCPGSGPSAGAQAEQGTPVPACSSHRPAGASGTERRVTWSPRRPGREVQSCWGPVFTPSILPLTSATVCQLTLCGSRSLLPFSYHG